MTFHFWRDRLTSAPNPHKGEEPDSSGRPLEPSTHGRMGAAFGRDLSDVRVHDGGEAATVAARLGARAFAFGDHIGFAAGEYRPGTLAGDALLAHELAHVLQQRDTASSPAAAAAAHGGTDAAFEVDATRSALVAVAATHGGGVSPGLAMPERRGGPALRRCSDEQKAQAQAGFQAAVGGVMTGPRQPIPIPFPDPDAARGMLDLQYGINREDFLMWQMGHGHSPKWTRFYGTNYIDWSHYLQYGQNFGEIWPYFLQDAWNGTIPRERNRRGIQRAQ